MSTVSINRDLRRLFPSGVHLPALFFASFTEDLPLCCEDFTGTEVSFGERVDLPPLFFNGDFTRFFPGRITGSSRLEFFKSLTWKGVVEV